MRTPVRPRVRTSGPSTFTGYGSSTPAGLTYAADTAAYTLGTAFSVSGAGYSLTKIRLFLDSGSGAITAGDVVSAGSLSAKLYAAADAAPGATGATLVTAVTLGSVTVNAWNEFVLGAQFALTSGVIYYAAVWMPGGRYSARSNEFTSPVASGPISFPANGSTQGTSGTVRNGAFRAGSDNPPDAAFNAAWYGVDVEVTG
jgi:hypothetical protein